MVKYLQSVFLFGLIFVWTKSLYAQDKIIQGVVTAADNGAALKGVTVAAAGSNAITVSRDDGSFTLSAPENTDELIFSYIGYETKIIQLRAQTMLYIALHRNY